MKKLLCVRLPTNTDPRSPKLEVGSIYTGIRTTKHEGLTYWLLQETQDGEFNHWYEEGCFSELDSDIDERERMAEKYINEKNAEHYARHNTGNRHDCDKPC